MKIGRKIYYLLVSGTVLCETGEREGEVRETTIEEDFTIYPELQGHNLEDVGYIELNFKHDSDKFGKYYYSIDKVSKNIVWGELIPPPLPSPTTEEIIDKQVQIKMGENLKVLDVSLSLLQEGGVI